MPDRRLVLDANIIVRAVLGNRVRDLIEHYCTEVHMLAPGTAFAEVDEHLPTIFAKRGLSPRFGGLAGSGVRTDIGVSDMDGGPRFLRHGGADLDQRSR